ncbi:bacterial regulatory helix-turn-helix s, AraC family protein [Bacteroides fragilis str. 3998T(B)3]|jgi:AraC-like DNA-binding protein|nr:bacterial regulatory helix-turn-helix s, AraC family protein [Bacteroides fragilis str. 3998T(B)3]
MDCGHFHTLLQQELFFLLRGFYLKEELALLFHPIISAELTFKDFVIGNYFKVSNVNDLISLSNMCKSSFYCKFKEVFGMTAKQWLLKQRNTHILNKVMTSETTVGELMEEFRFESQAHFTHYCKQHFNCTPRELIMKYQVVNQ